MPSRTEKPKGRSKEDTWGAPELTSTIQDASADRERKVRDKDREKRRDRQDEDKRHRDRDKDRRKERSEEKHSREDRERRSKEKTKDGSDRKREHREREGSSRDERSKDERRKSKDKDREERDRTREEDNRDRERKREKRERDEKERRRSEKSSHRDEGDERRERRERDDKENRKSERDRHRDRDEDGKERRDERRRRKDHSESRGESEKDRKREKERSAKENQNRSHREETDESGRRHEEKRSRHKERDSEKRRDEDKEARRRRKEAEKERESSGRDKNKSKEDDDEEERERRRRKEEKRRREKEREEKEKRKKSETQQSRSEETIENDIEEEDGKNQEAEANDYEDDFEDYEDDFEDEDVDEDDTGEENDIDDSTLLELRRAMEAENQASRSGRASYSQEQSSAGSTRPATSTRRTFINFVAAKQRQISNTVAERTKKRGQVLMKLIELDTVTFDLFDMPPVKDYERYIQFFGRSDTRQVSVQCNDDNLEREVQTENIEYQEKWCQHPSEGLRCCGGNDETLEEDLEFAINQEAHSIRLTEFLQTAGQLMAVLLEENRVESGGKLQSNQRSIVFSEGYTQLKAELSFLKGRPICSVQVHPVQTHLILTAYGKAKIPNDDVTLSNRGILCVWNINDPLKPQRILSCRSHPKCCAWSPTKPTMAFAGTEDGSVMVWDLRESSSMHQHHTVDGDIVLVRVPTFSTDGILSEDSHNSGVVSLLPIVTAEDNLRASMPQSQQTAGTSDSSFQIASLEERGVIHFWVVLEIAKTSLAGSESELGLVPGGRVKLIRSSSISLNSPNRGIDPSDSFKSVCMQLNPADPSHFYIGTDKGVVLHASRHLEKVHPREYKAHIDVPVEVSHLDFSPFSLSCFLVGCVDGSIRLHSLDSEVPLLTWPNSTMGMEVTALAWSHSRPSVFFSVDTTSKVYVWSLLEKDGNPVKIEQFSNGRLTGLDISNDFSASSMGRPGRKPELVIADEKGGIEVHRLNERFSSASGDELDAMAALLESLV